MVLIVDDLLLFPVRLGAQVVRAIGDMVDKEMLNTREAVQERALEVSLSHDQGMMKEEDYRQEMARLEKRLKELEG